MSIPFTAANRLLASLTAIDLAALTPHLESLPLALLTKLELPGRRIEYVYFIDAGIASIVAVQPQTSVEVGIVGLEGMTGLAVVNGNDRSPYATYMQAAGSGRRISAPDLRTVMQARPSMRDALLRYSQALMIQASQTAVANARANVEERLARWLLMAHDRIGRDDIPLTHEFLALMMGAGRPGVTEAIHGLAKKGLIRGERGKVILIDRAGLEERAGQYYGMPEKEYERLLPETQQAASAAD